MYLHTYMDSKLLGPQKWSAIERLQLFGKFLWKVPIVSICMYSETCL